MVILSRHIAESSVSYLSRNEPNGRCAWALGFLIPRCEPCSGHELQAPCKGEPVLQHFSLDVDNGSDP